MNIPAGDEAAPVYNLVVLPAHELVAPVGDLAVVNLHVLVVDPLSLGCEVAEEALMLAGSVASHVGVDSTSVHGLVAATGADIFLVACGD